MSLGSLSVNKRNIFRGTKKLKSVKKGSCGAWRGRNRSHVSLIDRTGVPRWNCFANLAHGKFDPDGFIQRKDGLLPRQHGLHCSTFSRNFTQLFDGLNGS